MLKGRYLQYISTFLVQLNMLNIGFCIGWTSPFLPILENDPSNKITTNEGSWIATAYFLSGPIGTIFSRFTLDKIGRKKTLLFAALPFMTSWLIIAFTQNKHFLLCARLIAGIGDGVAITIIPIYLAEISDPKIRGLLSSFIGISIVIGVLLINVLGHYLNITYSAIICGFFPLIFILLFSWIPETPNYFIIKEDIDKAQQVLRIIYNRENVDDELCPMIEGIKEESKNSAFLELFKVKSNRYAMLILVGVTAAQQFSGIMPVAFYTQTILEETSDSFPVILSTVLFYVASLVFSTISAFFVDCLGRRPLLIVSVLCTGLCLMAQGIMIYIKHNSGAANLSWYIIAAILLFTVSYSTGLLSIPQILVGELLSVNVKAVGVLFYNICYYSTAAIASVIFQFTNDSYGLHAPFFVFSFCCLISFIFVVFFVPETKKKSLEEIQIELGTFNVDI